MCAKIGTKRVDGLVEVIFLLIGCALRFGEPDVEFVDGFFKTRDFAI